MPSCFSRVLPAESKFKQPALEFYPPTGIYTSHFINGNSLSLVAVLCNLNFCSPV